MVNSNPLLSSINSGEFSPHMEGRVDFDRYPNAAKMCRNLLMLPQGGMTRRPGTRFIKEVKDSTALTRLEPFVFSEDQAYVVEMGNAYMRFYRRQARITVDDISASVTNGTFGSGISSWSDPDNSVSSSYVAGTNDITALTTYTFVAATIGTAATNRVVVVTICAEQETDDTARTISSVTIGGVTATINVQAGAASGVGDHYQVTGIASAAIATGTTADIVVTFSGAMDNCRVDRYRVLALSSAAFATDSDVTISAGVVSATANIPAGGSAISVAHFDSTAAVVTGATWTGLTEQSDASVETNQRGSTANLDSAGGNSALAVTATRAGGGATDSGTMCIATFAGGISWDNTNQRMTISAGGGHAEQSITIGGGNTALEHVLQFRIAGYGGGTLKFRVGTASGGTDVINDYVLGIGEHSIGFTPGATPVYIGFVNVNNPTRDMYLDNVAFIDNAPMEVVSPFSTTQVADLRVFQAADVMYLLHPDFVPRRLERRGHKSWSIVEAFFEDGPWGDINDGTTLSNTQLVTNPFFDGTTSWTFANDADNSNTATFSAAGGGVTLSRSSNNPYIYQQVSCTSGVKHVIHFFMTGTKNKWDLQIGNAAQATTYYNGASVDAGWTTAEFTPASSSFFITVRANGNSGANSISLLSCLVYSTATHLLQPSATTGSVTVTAYGFTPFASTDVGRYLRFEQPGSEPGYGVITAYTSTSVVTMLVLRKLPGTAPFESWRLGEWCSVKGFPQVIGFFDGRLVAANTDDQTQTLWFSQSNDLQNMRIDSYADGSSTVEDDDAIDITLNSKRIDPILWLMEQDKLLIGTGGSPWTITSTGAVVTPSDVSAKAGGGIPSAAIQAEQINTSTIFVDKSQRQVYDLGYDFNSNGYVATDLTILADHIFHSPCQNVRYQRRPFGVLWCPRLDGRLATLSFNKQHEVLGWSQQIMGGSYSTGDPVVESVAVIPGASDATQVANSDERDEVWVIVKRTINGSTKRYIEVFETAFEGPYREDYTTEGSFWTAVRTAQKSSYYADCCITYNSSATTTITGLSHLEGQTVKVLADGIVIADKTVSGGSITLATAASIVQVGLGYTHRYLSLKAPLGATTGTSINKVKAITGVGVVVLDCGTFDISTADFDEESGYTLHDLYTFQFIRNRMLDITQAIPVYTGEAYKSTESTFSTDPRIYMEGDAPLPFTVLAIAPHLELTDET